jgi:molecular chaperone GrpE
MEDRMAGETMVEGIEESELKDRGWKHRDSKAAEPETKLDGSETSGEQTVEAGGEAGTDPSGALKSELEQLRGERDQLLDRLARLQAEFENARRRETKERGDLRDYAVQGAIEPFLGVMDNFQLALKSQGSLEQLRGGVGLILKQMEEALKSLQVQPVETVGTMFDPRVHEALGSIETAEHPDHQVLEEIRRGYKIRDKLLRPALVKIASNKVVVSD